MAPPEETPVNRANSWLTFGRSVAIIALAVVSIVYTAYAHDGEHTGFTSALERFGHRQEQLTDAVLGINALVDYDLNEGIVQNEKVQELCQLHVLSSDSEECLTVDIKLERSRDRRAVRARAKARAGANRRE